MISLLTVLWTLFLFVHTVVTGEPNVKVLWISGAITVALSGAWLWYMPRFYAHVDEARWRRGFELSSKGMNLVWGRNGAYVDPDVQGAWCKYLAGQKAEQKAKEDRLLQERVESYDAAE